MESLLFSSSLWLNDHSGHTMALCSPDKKREKSRSIPLTAHCSLMDYKSLVFPEMELKPQSAAKAHLSFSLPLSPSLWNLVKCWNSQVCQKQFYLRRPFLTTIPAGIVVNKNVSFLFGVGGFNAQRKAWRSYTCGRIMVSLCPPQFAAGCLLCCGHNTVQ